MVSPSSTTTTTTTTTWSDMDCVLSGSNRKRVIEELLKGRDSATQLQLLLLHPQHLIAPPHLLLNICNSFSHSLSILNSAGRSDKRGCYKRRKNTERWTTITPTTEDGRAWRKYGQKHILNSKYPRAYFRCTRKVDQGCRATKQVQLMEDGSRLYSTTYIGVHTCTTDVLDSEPNWDSSNNNDDQSKLQSTNCHSSNLSTAQVIKEEENKDSIVIPTNIDSISWPDVLSFDSSEAVSMVYSCNDTSSRSLDMDFGVTSVDFDNFDENVFM